ncbi:hypothetical protein GCM10020331_018740 [Ectobacillus funiculus]
MEQLTLGVYRSIQRASHLYLRTKEHPVVKDLEEEGIAYTSFDDIYEAHDSFEQVYETIAETLLTKAKEQEIIYAVPGHPLVAERTVQLLLEKGPSCWYSRKSRRRTKLPRSFICEPAN